jgi:hypothetical protein
MSVEVEDVARTNAMLLSLDTVGAVVSVSMAGLRLFIDVTRAGRDSAARPVRFTQVRH